MGEVSRDFLYRAREIKIGGVEISSTYFNSFLIRKNFFEHRFPIMVLTVNIPPATLYEILQNVDISNGMTKVELDLIWKDLDNDYEPGLRYISGEYVGILDESYTDFIPYAHGEHMEENKSAREGDGEQLRIALYREDDINAFKHGYINSVFQDFNVATAISYGFKETTDGSLDLFLSPPDNQNVYEQDLIVPMGFYQYIDYLDKEMGIYDTDYNIFIDDGEVYILNKKTEHGIEPIDDDKLNEPLEFEIAPSYDVASSPGIELQHPRKYHLKEYAITNQLDIEKFGHVYDFHSGMEDLDFEETYQGINSINIRSNRFEKHHKKKFEFENYIIKFENLPFTVKPYTDINIKGQYIEGRFRIVDYFTIISDDDSFTRLTVKKSVE